MSNLPMWMKKLLSAWNQGDFAELAVAEFEALDIHQLPLQQAIQQGNYLADQKFKVMLINSSASEESLLIKCGVFFTSILAGCSCADDPTPDSEFSEYCELIFCVDRRSGNAEITLLDNDN